MNYSYQSPDTEELEKYNRVIENIKSEVNQRMDVTNRIYIERTRQAENESKNIVIYG